MGILLCEQNFRNVWIRNESVRAEIGQILHTDTHPHTHTHTHTHTTAAKLVVRIHIERMADDRLPKRAAEIREEGRGRRGRPRLRWEDCVKTDVRTTGKEEDWKKKTRDRGGWKRLPDEAVKKLRAAHHP